MSDSRAVSPAPVPSHRKRIRGRIAVLLTAVLAVLLWPSAREHLRAISLLARMAHQQTWIIRLRNHSYEIQTFTFQSTEGAVRAKLYVPSGVQHPPAMVLVHGLHQLGIEEPRLVNFAQALAESGVEVLTPQLDALADYRVDAESIDVIGHSAQELAERVGEKQVGILSLSFAGGLSLMAAANSRYAGTIAYVAAVGAQDDLQRVEHYLVEGHTVWPNGNALTIPPHEYGWLILIYSHPEDFFSAGDVNIARNCLRLLLHEQVDDAKREAQKLSTNGQKLVNLIFEHQRETFREKLLADLNKYSEDARAVSPHDHLQQLHAEVLLIHGEGDNVIPASETAWLALDVPHGYLQGSLISRAISHVSLETQPGWRDQLALVHWVALMLGDADRATTK